MTERQAAKLVCSILSACPTQAIKLDGERQLEMAHVYYKLLEDLSYEACDAALRVLCHSKPFIPAPADIRGMVLELELGPVRPGGEAWGEVKRAILRWGWTRWPGVDVAFDDAITRQCVRELTWWDLTHSENAVADRARFIELYDQLATQARKEAQAPLLAAAREARALAARQAQERRALSADRHLRLVVDNTVSPEARAAREAAERERVAAEREDCARIAREAIARGFQEGIASRGKKPG